MPFLLAPFAAFFAGVFGAMVTSAATFFTKRVAARLTVVALLITIWGAFSAAVHSIMASVTAMMGQGVLSLGMSLLPSNTSECVGLIMSAHAAEFLLNQAKVVMMIKNPY